MRQLSEQADFFALHLAARSGFGIVVAKEVQQTMDEVTDQFGGPGGAEAAGLRDRFVHTDKNFGVK